MYKVGYVDEDVDQLNTFERKLRGRGFEIVKFPLTQGMTIEELMKTVYDSGISLLVIDFKLAESGIVTFDGDEVQRRLFESKYGFPYIFFTSHIPDARAKVDDIRNIMDKGMLNDASDIDLLVETITKAVNQYTGRINRKRDELTVLISKSELTMEEKEEIANLQNDLNSMNIDNIPEVPAHLLSNTF